MSNSPRQTRPVVLLLIASVVLLAIAVAGYAAALQEFAP